MIELFHFVDGSHKKDGASSIHAIALLHNDVSQSDSKLPSSGISSSSDEMSADSLEDESSTRKLSIELENVKIGDSQVAFISVVRYISLGAVAGQLKNKI